MHLADTTPALRRQPCTGNCLLKGPRTSHGRSIRRVAYPASGEPGHGELDSVLGQQARLGADGCELERGPRRSNPAPPADAEVAVVGQPPLRPPLLLDNRVNLRCFRRVHLEADAPPLPFSQNVVPTWSVGLGFPARPVEVQAAGVVLRSADESPVRRSHALEAHADDVGYLPPSSQPPARMTSPSRRLHCFVAATSATTALARALWRSSWPQLLSPRSSAPGSRALMSRATTLSRR
jgi:hypothetical protein